MFMADNKKKASQIIAGMGAAPEDMPLEDGAEVDASIGLESAAEELIDALHSKDPKAVVAAFQAMSDMCESAEPEAEPEYSAEEEAE